MKFTKFVFILLFLIVGFRVLASDTLSKQTWIGKLSYGTQELTLVLHVYNLSPDSLTATVDSPDQGAAGIQVTEIRMTPDSLAFGISKLRAVYGGKFNASKDTLSGTFTQAGYKLPLTLAATEHEYKLNRPQEPRPPYLYNSDEVTVKNTTAGVDLAGTLTYPTGRGPFPAIVLVTGSGPEDRDEQIFGHKPFLVLADHLTRAGFAVLRYDDRGVGRSTGDYSTATTFDFADDATAAFEFLKRRSDIDTSHIGILGHSEGGLIAEIIAARRTDIGFIVLLAGTALKGEEILRLQSGLISRANGIPEDQIAANLKISDQIYSILKKNDNNDKAAVKIRKALEDFEKKEGQGNPNSIPEARIESQIRTVTSPWFRTFLTLDPMTYIQKIACPVLALFGEMDLQVPPAENMKALETGLLMAGNDRYTIDFVPGVNHLFQTATTGSPEEYGRIEETLSPIVLEMITSWLKQNVR